MATDDLITVRLNCTSCGATGKAEFTEPDYPGFMASDRTKTLLSIEGPFNCVRYGEIFCTACGWRIGGPKQQPTGSGEIAPRRAVRRQPPKR